MTELTLHTGVVGDHETIHIDWVDNNNVRQSTDLEIVTHDRPIRLEIRVSGYSDIIRKEGDAIVVVEAKS